MKVIFQRQRLAVGVEIMLKTLTKEEKKRLKAIVERKKDLVEEAKKNRIIEEDLNEQLFSLFDLEKGAPISWDHIVLSLCED